MIRADIWRRIGLRKRGCRILSGIRRRSRTRAARTATRTACRWGRLPDRTWMRRRPAIMSPFSVMKGDGTDGGVAVEAVGRGSAVGRKLTLQEAARVLRLSVRQVRRTGRSPVSDELGWRGSLAGPHHARSPCRADAPARAAVARIG